MLRCGFDASSLDLLASSADGCRGALAASFQAPLEVRCYDRNDDPPRAPHEHRLNAVESDFFRAAGFAGA
jgi:hypothetical protein